MEWYSKSKKIEFCCAIGMTGNYSHPIIYTPVRCQSCMGDWPGFWPPYLFVVSEPQGGLGEHMHPMVLIMFRPYYPNRHVQPARANRAGGSTTCRHVCRVVFGLTARHYLTKKEGLDYGA